MKPAQHCLLDRLPALASSRLQALVAQHLGATFPAAALVVLQGGDVRFSGAWGWLDPYTQSVPATVETRFDLASLTKLFTATAVLQQVSAGRIRLDDPLVSVIPEFGGPARALDGGQDPFTRLSAAAPPARAAERVSPERVTFRQLLAHTSGLAPWRATFLLHPLPPAPPALSAEAVAERHARVVAAICTSAFTEQPGVRVQYSDLGYILLGEAVQRLTGLPLARAIAEGVLAPLGLEAVGFRPLEAGISADQLAPTEYDFGWRGRRLLGEVDDENACGMGGIAGHAGLFGMAGALAQFGEAWRVCDPRLRLDAAVQREALAVVHDSQGAVRRLGWAVGLGAGESAALPEATVAGHTGFTGTSLWVQPERGLVIACMTNRVFYGRDPQGIAAFRTALHTLLD